MTTQDALDAVRLTAHQRAMATDPAYRAGYEKFLQDRRERKEARQEKRRVKRRLRHVRTIMGAARATDSRLPSLQVFISGTEWREVVALSPVTGYYDFAVDVRELVCEPLAFDRVAMWADPRERL